MDTVNLKIVTGKLYSTHFPPMLDRACAAFKGLAESTSALIALSASSFRKLLASPHRCSRTRAVVSRSWTFAHMKKFEGRQITKLENILQNKTWIVPGVAVNPSKSNMTCGKVIQASRSELENTPLANMHVNTTIT